MVEQKMKLEDWLDDLCVRFIINLPREELESVERICFQVEEAQWFYEDFVRPLDPNLPSFNLRSFALLIFQHCPLMSQWSSYHHSTAFSEFLAYKTRVPVRGAILLNETMDEVVLVKGWKKTAGWSFPRGKINKDEKDLDCAAREVYEETGFDIKQSGLIKDEEKVKYIDISMREQNMRLYVIRGVPKDTHFEPRTRKEISKIEWYKLSDLPTQKKVKQEESNGQSFSKNKFYMVAPFLGPLKRWIALQRKRDLAETTGQSVRVEAENPAYITAEDGELTNGGALRKDESIAAPFPKDFVGAHAHQDPSTQLKQLLNIGSTTQPVLPLLKPEQIMPEPATGSALLQLLKQGDVYTPPSLGQKSAHSSFPEQTTATLPQPSISLPAQSHDRPINQPTVPMPTSTAGTIGQGVPTLPNSTLPSHQVYPQPGFITASGFSHPPPERFSHFPQLPRPPMVTSTHQGHQYHLPQSNRPSLAHPPVDSSGTLISPALANLYFNAPQAQPRLPSNQHVHQSSQVSRPSNFQAPSIPPASKLPPPKLNRHSLALLNVFKGDSLHQPTTDSKEVPPEPQRQAGVRRFDHQDSLLKLLRTPTSPAVTPSTSQANAVKLSILPESEKAATSKLQESIPPTSQSVTGEKAILLKAPGPSVAPKESLDRPKSAGRLPPPIPAQSQIEPRSNITILPRPSAVTKESSETLPRSQTPRSPSRKNVKISELTKPFKPRILRRPDKDNLEASLPTHTVTVSAFTKPHRETMLDEPEASKGPPKELNYDRQSQSSSHKETLLSLFGKSAPSREQPLPKFTEVEPSQLRSSAKSSIVGFVGGSLPQTHGNGESRPTSRNKMTYPVDKAFLLGYLDGVVKGQR
ncbi:mRNA-decapping enzyme subunit 2 [Coccidioides immitis RMSCC 3703]|uniref:mRNA-decapping enzyme subunit 2 n=1 Tax=Coccidioides immitis RMSCC 3703 TaxID=454286 RepID=A0A0J8TK63_COCIT|nr:mRNA-decapping enzyme subunit 2 [Coccidioides immitis RMSCC 3703]